MRGRIRGRPTCLSLVRAGIAAGVPVSGGIRRRGGLSERSAHRPIFRADLACAAVARLQMRFGRWRGKVAGCEIRAWLGPARGGFCARVEFAPQFLTLKLAPEFLALKLAPHGATQRDGVGAYPGCARTSRVEAA